MVSASAPPMIGGLETHIGEVGPRLVAAHFEVTLLTTDPTADLPATEQRDGVEVIRVRSWLADEGIYAAPGLYRAIVEDDWDLVHVQGYHTLAPPLAMLAAVRAGVPFVVTFHSGGYDLPAGEQLRWAQHLVLRPLLLRAKKLIAVSDWERREMRRALRLRDSRFLTIPNGAAIAAPATQVTEDPCLIVSVGRLHRYKGHQYAIAAMPYLLEAMPGVRLRIVGTGPYELELRQLAADLGVEHSVEIGGSWAIARRWRRCSSKPPWSFCSASTSRRASPRWRHSHCSGGCSWRTRQRSGPGRQGLGRRHFTPRFARQDRGGNAPTADGRPTAGPRPADLG